MTDSQNPGSAAAGGDIALLRKVVARELDTISEYEEFARLAQDEHLRAFFQHLADEEKEHVAEAFALIGERDTVQKRYVDNVDVRPEHFETGRSAGTSHTSVDHDEHKSVPSSKEPSPNGSVPRQASRSHPVMKSAYTVGSLKTRR